MKKLLNKLPITDYRLPITFIFCLLLTATSFAAVTNISSGGLFSSLGDAVSAAGFGDTLRVSTGVYYETVNIYNQNLAIEGNYNDDFSKKVTGGKSIISAPRGLPTFSGSTFDITNSTVYLEEIEITKGGFKINTSGFGGGLDIRHASDVTLYRCSIYDNFALGQGGGVYVYNSSFVATNSLVFENNVHSGFMIGVDNNCGGGIFAENSDVNLFSISKIYNNSAGKKGGGIFLKNSEAATSLSSIYENSADSGGGVAAYSSTFNQKSVSYIYANTAATKGGGIFLENNSTATISDASVVGYPYAYGPNLVTNGSGGGVYAADSTLILSNLANVAHNIASEDGGGVYLTNSSLLAYSSKIGRENMDFTNSAYKGGGVFAINSILNFSNSFITHGDAYYGGGVFLQENSDISNCNIIDNYAEFGGGIYCRSGGDIYGCTVSNNYSFSYGGGIDCLYNGTIYNCDINNNYSYYGGGVCLYIGGIVSNCNIYDNSSEYGGGIYCEDSGIIDNCFINGNYASNDGGGLYYFLGGSLSKSIVSNNGAYYYGGGIVCDSGGAVSDSTFIGNSAKLGGGIVGYAGGAFTNCLISGLNTATFGGGVYLKKGGEIFNCTISGNNADQLGGGIICSNGGSVVNTIIYNNQAFSGNNNWKSYASNIVFNYCCTTPTNGLPGGNQCISDNPMFINPGSDYQLQEGSPCIDAGYNMPWMNPPTTDLAGNPRKHDGTVDIGCYEFVPEGGMVFSILCSVFCAFIYRMKFNFIKNKN